MRKQWTVLINTENSLYECSKQIWIYSKHDVWRANFINVETDFISAEKPLLWNSNLKKHSNFAFKFGKHDFHLVFYEKTANNLCSEQRIIYAEKTMNNFK